MTPVCDNRIQNAITIPYREHLRRGCGQMQLVVLGVQVGGDVAAS